MKLLRYAIPSKKHHCDEGGFHKECQNTFNSERCTEYIAYEETVVGPVGSELKFQNNAGSNANCEVNTEQLLPEFCPAHPLGPVGPIVDGFGNCHNDPQS